MFPVLAARGGVVASAVTVIGSPILRAAGVDTSGGDQTTIVVAVIGMVGLIGSTAIASWLQRRGRETSGVATSDSKLAAEVYADIRKKDGELTTLRERVDFLEQVCLAHGVNPEALR